MVSQAHLFESPPEDDFDFASMLAEAAAPPSLRLVGDPDGLRWYQREAYNQTLLTLQRVRAALLVMATGLGKSRTLATIVKHWDGPVLVLAHRDELVRQLVTELERTTGERVEIEQAELRCSSKARIVVGSTPTLANKARRERMGVDRFTLVVKDEAHHSLAPSYRAVLEYFNAKLLGVTATPDRTDEKALAQLFDEVAYCFDIQAGIQTGYLVPVRGRQVQLQEIDLTGVEAGRGEGGLVVGQLDEAMLKAVEGIVTKTLELEPGRQGIAFFPGVKTAEFAAVRFNALKPYSAAFVSGTTPPDERQQIMADFKSGKTQYLCNCQIATEGVDVPSASLIIQGRPTTSRSLYTQMTGRATRVLPGIVDHIHGPDGALTRRVAISASAKPDCVVLDFVGNSGKHSLVGPVDVLGGNYTEAEVKAAKRKVASGTDYGDVRAALEEARRELKAMADKAKSKVTATVRNFDPFVLYGVNQDEEQRFSQRFGHVPLTDGQFDALIKLGVPEAATKGMSKRAASKMLDEARRRRDAGLASLKQVRKLQEFGVTDTNVPMAKAKAAMDYLSSKGWRNIDPKQLNEILLQPQRQPGSNADR